jgi:hypothetical protein
MPWLILLTGPVLSTFTAVPQPPDGYERRFVQGFTILVHRDVLSRDKVADAALREMEKQLGDVNCVLREKALARLRRVTIWVEWEKKKHGAAEYHPSARWLRQNGYDPRKVHSIEISNARNFVTWSRRDQPSMILHELAHAYHFQVLGSDHAGIEAAYRQAVERKLYDSVAHVAGGKRKAYALTNSREYFAEITEAYFGRNDFFPFTRDELRRHDPAGFRLLEEVWTPAPQAKRQTD